jgi:hypothetical protein
MTITNLKKLLQSSDPLKIEASKLDSLKGLNLFAAVLHSKLPESFKKGNLVTHREDNVKIPV